MGMKPKPLDSTADDKSLEEERLGYDREGNKQPNFASSLVPTLEETTVTEHEPQSQAERKSTLDNTTDHAVICEQNDLPKPEGVPSEARVHDGSGELYGAPADASIDSQTDNQAPHTRQGKDDSNDAEKTAVRSRSVLRRHLSTRIGAKPWTLPVPGPIIDPHGFEDPICDKFYKDVWVAAAVHNVRANHLLLGKALSPRRPRYIARSFMLSQMIL